jgi:hypothetical protein
MVKLQMRKEHQSLYLAKMLIEEHGDLASEHAKRQAQRLIGEADVEGGAAWMRIARAVDMLLDGQGSGTLH